MTRPAADQPVITGAGIAGSAAAIGLARGGMTPLILEKHRETGDTICGGFLSWQSLAALERLGLDAAALGGHCVTRLRLYAGQRQLSAALPAAGMGLSRHRLDSLLLAAAQSAGAGVERGVTVKSLFPGGLRTADGATLQSATILLASGKTNLPGQPRIPPGRAAQDPVIGLRQRIAATPATAALVGDAVELFLFDRGYAGLVRQEDGSANLCLAVHKSRLSEAGGQPEALISAWAEEQPQLAARLAAGAAVGSIDAIAAIPYGWQCHAATPGLWRLGDQAAVIPSLAGEGMGIALASAASAAAAIGRGQAAEQWQPQLAARTAGPMRVARAVWAAAESPRWNAPGLAALRHMPWLLHWLATATRIDLA